MISLWEAAQRVMGEPGDAPRRALLISESRDALRAHLTDISWETEVWLADAPSHLIHFNGSRFSAPYAP